MLEQRKRVNYLDLAQRYHFVAVVVETTGAMGTDALDHFADIGSQIRAVTHKAHSQSTVSVALIHNNVY